MSLFPKNYFQIYRIRAYFIIGITLMMLTGAVYFSYQPQSGVFGHVYTHQPTQKKVVALTFDDGPNGQATEQVLNILQQEKIQATFFLVGDNVLKYPDIARQITAQGNEVGNHTMHHTHLLPFATPGVIRKDLNETNEIIFENTGQYPALFRPPFGFRTPWVIDTAQDDGFIVVTWNDLTTDYLPAETAAQVKKNILSRVKPGTIIVLHDGYGTKHGANRDDMITALPQIIEALKAQGYSFDTVSQLMHE